MLKIALFGDPDVGKTTFYKTVTGASFKEYASRTETLRHAQYKDLLFFDAPGHAYLKHLKNEALNMCDIVLYLIDSTKTNFSELKQLFSLKGPPIIVCINKWDAVSEIKTPLKEQLANTEFYVKLESFINKISSEGVLLQNLCDGLSVEKFNGLCFPISAKTGWGCKELCTLLKKLSASIVKVNILYQVKPNLFELYGDSVFDLGNTYCFDKIFKKIGKYYTCKLKIKFDKITRSDNRQLLSLKFDLPEVRVETVYIYADTAQKYDALYEYCKARKYKNVFATYAGNTSKDFILAWSDKKPAVYSIWNKSFLELVHQEEQYLILEKKAEKDNLLKTFEYYGTLELLSQHVFSYKKKTLIVGAIAHGPVKIKNTYFIYEQGDYKSTALLEQIQLNRTKHATYNGTDAIAVKLSLQKDINVDAKCVAVSKACVMNFEKIKLAAPEIAEKIKTTPGLGIEPRSPA